MGRKQELTGNSRDQSGRLCSRLGSGNQTMDLTNHYPIENFERRIFELTAIAARITPLSKRAARTTMGTAAAVAVKASRDFCLSFNLDRNVSSSRLRVCSRTFSGPFRSSPQDPNVPVKMAKSFDSLV